VSRRVPERDALRLGFCSARGLFGGFPIDAAVTTVCAFAIIALGVLLWDTNERARRAIAALDAVDMRLAAAIRRLARRQVLLEKRLPAAAVVGLAASPAEASLIDSKDAVPAP
jgi:hypothetical protein